MADVSSGSGAMTPARAWVRRHLEGVVVSTTGSSQIEPAKGLVTGHRYRLDLKKEVIPIIFVPGIMGSRLETSEDKKKVWDPGDKVWMFRKYGTIVDNAKSKKQAIVGDVFNTDYLRPIADDQKHATNHYKEFPEALARGWGTVSEDSYGLILRRLQETDWGAPVRDWFELPVYAFGYNWTASCLSAGEKLVEKIKKLIREHRQDGTRHCEKVILVTHSMGGLVARAACHFLGELQSEPSDGRPSESARSVSASSSESQETAKVLHCIHGVQPVNGGAAAYWRMKAGFERRGWSLRSEITAWVLGTNGREVTALLANMPGGLELLPSQHYEVEPLGSPYTGGSRSWLRVLNLDGSLYLALPSGPHPDPYEEIYLEKKAYWRLADPAYLEAVAPDAQHPHPNYEKLDSWTRYTRYIRSAKAFHADIGTGRHASTTSFAGTGVDTAVTITFRTSKLRSRGRYGIGTTGQVPTDRGTFRAHVLREDDDRGDIVAIDQPSEKGGDGTVPRFSGAALFSSGSPAVEHYDFPGVEHEPAYKDAEVMALTVDTIRRICQNRISETIG